VVKVYTGCSPIACNIQGAHYGDCIYRVLTCRLHYTGCSLVVLLVVNELVESHSVTYTVGHFGYDF